MVMHSRNGIRDCTYMYTCSRRYTEHASSQREEPSREIILTRSHICATVDGYESIKISHREPRIGRGNISNIRRADPSPASHPLSRSLPSLVSLHHTSLFFVSLIAPYRLSLIRTFIISALETFFIDCPGTSLSDTGCKLFLPFALQEVFLLVFSPRRPPTGLYRCPCSFFPRSNTFYVVFPDMSRGHEYINPGLGSWKIRDTGRRFYLSIEVGNVSVREWRN